MGEKILAEEQDVRKKRHTDTEDKIRRAFLALGQIKPVSKITVSDICREAGIHRTTFYMHYLDVADLMEKMESQMYFLLMDIFAGEEDGIYHHGIERLFQYIYERREYFKMYLNAVGRFQIDATAMPEPLLKNLDIISRKLGDITKEELEYHQIFFCAGLSAIIMKWIRGNCKETPKEMAALIESEYNPLKITAAN